RVERAAALAAHLRGELPGGRGGGVLPGDPELVEYGVEDRAGVRALLAGGALDRVPGGVVLACGERAGAQPADFSEQRGYVGVGQLVERGLPVGVGDGRVLVQGCGAGGDVVEVEGLVTGHGVPFGWWWRVGLLN